MKDFFKAILSAGALLAGVSFPNGAATAGSGPVGLSAAIDALEEGMWGTALDSSETYRSNAWLEGYRLGARACAFMELGDTASSIAAARSFLELRNEGSPLFGHTFFRRVSDLVVAADREAVLPEDPAVYPEAGISSGSLMSMAVRLFDEGRTERSARLSRRSCELGIDSTAALAASAASVDTLFRSSLGEGCLLKIARALLSAGRTDRAGKLARILASRPGYEAEVMLLRAGILEKRKRKSSALTLYETIFEDERHPAEIRKRALARSASLLYSMKDYSGSARTYRTLAVAFPADPEAEASLDIAARIYLSRDRYDEAVETWTSIAVLGPKTDRGTEALLGCAAAMSLEGDTEGAREVLEALLEKGAGDYEPAALYWTGRVSGTRGEEEFKARLLEEFPRSVYAEVARRGTGFLIAGEDMPVSGGMLKSAGRSQRERLSRCLTGIVEAAEGGTGHPAAEAFGFFVGSGDIRRSRECAGFLARSGLLSREQAVLAALEAGVSGIPLLGLGLCCEGLDSGCAEDLLYPVLFEDLITGESLSRGVPAELVLSVIREESAFDPSAVSHAGATGLMQIIPSTGEWASSRTTTDYEGPGTLFDPSFSVEAGTWYLGFLLRRSSSSMVATLASYNAGHGRMSAWKGKYRPHEDPLLALELIGPAETRDYVRKVLKTLLAYRRIAMSGSVN